MKLHFKREYLVFPSHLKWTIFVDVVKLVRTEKQNGKKSQLREHGKNVRPFTKESLQILKAAITRDKFSRLQISFLYHQIFNHQIFYTPKFDT